MTNSLVELADVRKHYMLGETRVDALRGVSMSIDRGEFLAIVGPSGSGQEHDPQYDRVHRQPLEGRVLIDGAEVEHLQRHQAHSLSSGEDRVHLPVLQPHSRAQRVREHRVPPPAQQDRSPARSGKRPSCTSSRRWSSASGCATSPMSSPGGSARGSRSPGPWSPGPVIVLADEPTANLDSETGHKIVELMRAINSAEKTTFIFSTHDSHIMEHARRVITLHDGLVVGSDARG